MYRIGIDVGGTFTDVTLIDEETGRRFFAKVLNEPGRRHATVVKGIKRVMAQHNLREHQGTLTSSLLTWAVPVWTFAFYAMGLQRQPLREK